MIDTKDGRGEMPGIIYTTIAYVFWGLTPVYWRFLSEVPPFLLTTHRILWCALFVGCITLCRGRLRHIITILRRPRLLATLVLTSILITTNWTLFIYCVASHQLLEASLGYYLTPLISIALGVFMFGEHLSRWRMVGVTLAAVAVAVKSIALGYVPWLGLVLALSFGFYGYFRKKAPVDAMDGLLIENLVVLPFALFLIFYWWKAEAVSFSPSHFVEDALLVGSGPVTAIPLALFAAGARRIRLTTLGFLQYFSPTLTLLLATLGFHERFTKADGISFAVLWVALMIVALEGRFKPTEVLQEGG